MVLILTYGNKVLILTYENKVLIITYEYNNDIETGNVHSLVAGMTNCQILMTSLPQRSRNVRRECDTQPGVPGAFQDGHGSLRNERRGRGQKSKWKTVYIFQFEPRTSV